MKLQLVLTNESPSVMPLSKSPFSLLTANLSNLQGPPDLQIPYPASTFRLHNPLFPTHLLRYIKQNPLQLPDPSPSFSKAAFSSLVFVFPVKVHSAF